MFLRHLRGAPTSWVRHYVRGRVRHEGIGQSFWYRPLTAVLSEVPINDRELPLLFHARTSDFSDITVQATVTYRVSEPAQASARLDFSIAFAPFYDHDNVFEFAGTGRYTYRGEWRQMEPSDFSRWMAS